MKETLLGIVCCVPYSMYLITLLMYKKYNDIRSPTIFYMRNDEINKAFYKPLLENEDEMLDEKNEVLNNRNEVLNNENEVLNNENEVLNNENEV